MLLVLHCYQVPNDSNVREHPLEGFLWTVKTKCEYKLPAQVRKISSFPHLWKLFSQLPVQKGCSCSFHFPSCCDGSRSVWTDQSHCWLETVWTDSLGQQSHPCWCISSHGLEGKQKLFNTVRETHNRSRKKISRPDVFLTQMALPAFSSRFL